MIHKVKLAEKFSLFNTHWDPKIVGELNSQLVKLVKFQGEFVWHKHDNEDEFFMVIRGSFDMHLRDKVIKIEEGEFIIIPRGTEHKPVSEHEVEVMLFEPESVVNTGATESHLTTQNPERI